MQWLEWLFDSRSYMPHGHCYLWQPETLWLNVGGDVLIAASYFTIPLILYVFVRHRRHEIPYWWIPLQFAAFILLCGATHAFDIFTVWNAEYRMEGALKVLTGFVSASTAVALLRVMPGAMQLQTPTQLQREVEQRTEELARANDRLREEILSRQRAEHERARLLESEQAARAESDRANRSKDEFLAMLSHELRTPLSPILSWAQILRSEAQGDEHVSRGAAIIERNARTQVQLISDLLDMSRITAGKLRLDVQPVDLPQVVDAALETVRPSADARGIRIRCILEPLEEPVLGDPGRLQQVVWNLLSNAIKFTAKGGHVDVTLARANSHVELTVSDSGRGIEPDLLPYVFQRFQQGDSSAPRAHGGLGLGLAIVKELVELHGGQVRAASEGAGRGASFVVELPLVAVRSHDAGDRVHPRADALGNLVIDLPRLDGLHVLVIDDQRDAADGIALVLENAGAAVTIATSADEGLAAFAQRIPDVVVSDIGMPHRDGYEFIRAVRARHGRVPAAALTAFARSEDRTRALLAGYDAHIAKPVEVRELLATVAALADRRVATSSGAPDGTEP
jgi:signal transduction histidine kinase